MSLRVIVQPLSGEVRELQVDAHILVAALRQEVANTFQLPRHIVKLAAKEAFLSDGDGVSQHVEVTASGPVLELSLVASPDHDALVQSIVGGLDGIKAGVQVAEDWAIIRMVKDDPREEEFFRDYLFHLPSWHPSAEPIAVAAWTDNSSKGVRNGGCSLRFGAQGEVLVVKQFDGAVDKSHKLSALRDEPMQDVIC
mmetsp:Transcript_64396/g.188415  ORF Transcript_64396/g.188415 Transcript_64396/m.188415 type:complete len:196 (+) Transcript_64396:35-622(+)